MLNILSILKYMHTNLPHDKERYVVLDSEHIMDTKTGVELHTYDDWFKFTRDGETVAKMSDFTPQEQEVVWEIKKSITDPAVIKKMEEDYPVRLKERREALSNLFEYPEPVINKNPVMEEDTEEYQG